MSKVFVFSFFVRCVCVQLMFVVYLGSEWILVSKVLMYSIWVRCFIGFYGCVVNGMWLGIFW